jgi:protein-S-isoprenylcysteine O-methyltransferase Ste14
MRIQRGMRLHVLAITTFVLRNEERVLRSKFGAAFET